MSSPQQYSSAMQQSGYQTTPVRPTNGLAVTSLVLSILGWFTLITAIGGIICGHIARKQIRETGEGGAGMALAGLIIGYVLVVGAALSIIAMVVVFLFFGIGIFAIMSDPAAYESAILPFLA